MRAKISAQMLSDVARFQLICSVCSPIIRGIAKQGAVIMMRVSGKSSPVSFSVLIFSFTFELQSESSANVFHISWLFLHCWFWWVWNCQFIKWSAILGFKYYIVCYIIYNCFHIRGEGKWYDIVALKTCIKILYNRFIYNNIVTGSCV